MNDLTTLLRKLEAYVQAELGAQRRLDTLLEEQESAVRCNDTTTLVARGKALEAELATGPQRARLRDHLLGLFCELWGLGRGTLTLSSLIERAGLPAARLARLRAELRAAAAQVTRRTRRIASAARMHQRVTAEVIETLLAESERRCVADGGLLVDAEA